MVSNSSMVAPATPAAAMVGQTAKAKIVALLCQPMRAMARTVARVEARAREGSHNGDWRGNDLLLQRRHVFRKAAKASSLSDLLNQVGVTAHGAHVPLHKGCGQIADGGLCSSVAEDFHHTDATAMVQQKSGQRQQWSQKSGVVAAAAEVTTGIEHVEETPLVRPQLRSALWFPCGEACQVKNTFLEFGLRRHARGEQSRVRRCAESSQCCWMT